MASNGRNLSNLLGDNEKLTKEKISSDVPLGTEDISTVNDLSSSTNNQVGDQVYVDETNSLYIWTGNSWYNIALINQTPTWDSGGQPDAEYELDSIGGIATSITLSATDPDGIPIQWGYSITDSGNDLATISNDSNGTFTITAKSLDDILSAGYDSTGGTFDITFRASDGVNFATTLSEFTIAFKASSTHAQGSNYGYTSGQPPTNQNIVSKFSLTSDTNAANVGSLSLARGETAGQSSSEYGYNSGGNTYNVWYVKIDKFPFAADGTATGVGELTLDRRDAAGQSSTDYGYTSGGDGVTNIIDKFPFATNSNATDVGDLTSAKYGLAGQSSADYGYNTGGFAGAGSPIQNVIEKFPFATNANSTDVGDLTVGKLGAAGQNSADYGYTAGGDPIDKFSFASDANATSVGTLSVDRGSPAGQSSITHGYTSGGGTPAGASNIIDKFPFSSGGNATDVGDLTYAMSGTGQQY
jgi:hypothetical protein